MTSLNKGVTRVCELTKTAQSHHADDSSLTLRPLQRLNVSLKSKCDWRPCGSFTSIFSK